MRSIIKWTTTAEDGEHITKLDSLREEYQLKYSSRSYGLNDEGIACYVLSG